MFRQKKGDLVPYLDSKFQETIYARAFGSKLALEASEQRPINSNKSECNINIKTEAVA